MTCLTLKQCFKRKLENENDLIGRTTLNVFQPFQLNNSTLFKIQRYSETTCEINTCEVHNQIRFAEFGMTKLVWRKKIASQKFPQMNFEIEKKTHTERGGKTSKTALVT